MSCDCNRLVDELEGENYGLRYCILLDGDCLDSGSMLSFVSLLRSSVDRPTASGNCFSSCHV